MGLRFRKSFKIAPGVRVNLNKKSASISVGTKGARITKNTSGRTTTTVGIPGTGISYSKSHSSTKKASSTNQAIENSPTTASNTHARVKYPPRKPTAYTPPAEQPAADEAKAPAEPVDAMMAAYEKNPKGYKRSMQITRVLAPLLCIIAAVLMLASPIMSAVIYLCGVWLSTLPRTFKEKQKNQSVTPFYKRKAVIIALAFLVIWLILCMSIS